ncbi:MAG: hypothetical protein R3B06_09195 [Kofleriaceae bacterium]
MTRTPVLTAMLWTTVGGAMIGCGGSSAPIIDAAITDSQPLDGQEVVDAPSVDAPTAPLTYAATLTMSATCGGATTAGTLTITNTSAATVTITDITATGGFSPIFKPTTIDAGLSITIDVVPPDAVIGTDRGGDMVTGTLTIASDAAGALPTVALTSVVHGANLGFVDAAGNPISQLALTSATAECPTPATVYIKNTGNETAQLFQSGASNFSTGGFMPSSDVAPGATVTQDIRVLTFGGCTASETVVYNVVSGPSCDSGAPGLPVTFNIAGSSSCFCS